MFLVFRLTPRLDSGYGKGIWNKSFEREEKKEEQCMHEVFVILTVITSPRKIMYVK